MSFEADGPIQPSAQLGSLAQTKTFFGLLESPADSYMQSDINTAVAPPEGQQPGYNSAQESSRWAGSQIKMIVAG